MISYKGKIVLKDTVLEGYVSVFNDNIVYVGKECPKGKIVDFGNSYITPGLIDIHCHSSFNNSATENPKEVADFHLSHGVTTMLLTYYKDVPHDKLLVCLDKVKKLVEDGGNVYGAHLEGPYISGAQGYCAGERFDVLPDVNVYSEYLKFGIIRQWTSAPEIDGVIDFIKEIRKQGVIPAIGHSNASYTQVKNAYDNGAKIVTHIFDATGTAQVGTFKGTKDVSFDESCMLMDDMYYEAICDAEWVHVRKEKLDLLIKTVGIDKIVAITDIDCAGLKDDGRDIAVVDGQLFGTKLTLDKVAMNLFKAGYRIEDIFKMVSYNPARALNLLDRGEIDIGKKAHLCLFDEKMKFVKVLK